MNNMPTTNDVIVFNEFVRRQTGASPFTHWTLTDDEMLARIRQAIENSKVSEGYRPGVVLAQIAVQRGEFFTGFVTLKEGDELVGSYQARRPGETPRKSVYAKRQLSGKDLATYVDVILYHHDVLAEDGDETEGSDWEIISVNGRTTPEDAPIEPMTLMANHFGADGGTDTGMSPEEFEAQLRKSYNYWSDKAMLSP